jgi:hypothetical protein
MDIDIFFKYYFPFLFILFWLAVNIVISRISGWAALARVYRSDDSFDGECWRFQSSQMRYAMSYRNNLTIGADRRGLSLSILFLFRMGHPALFIPWADITVSEKQSFLKKMIEFRFTRVPGVYLRLSPKVAEKILANHTATGGQPSL